MIEEIVSALAVWLIPVAIAVVLHEVAHGYVALRLGDPTAKSLGRLSLNPIRHIDPFGTVLMPAMLVISGLPAFGYAKPVPIDPRFFDNPRKQMVWVALAGPVTNILLACVGALLFNTVPLFPAAAQGWVAAVLLSFVQVNLILAIFNMIPIPPLDGGRVATGLLPLSLARQLARLERYGILVVLGLVVVPGLIEATTGQSFPLLAYILLPPLELGMFVLDRLFIFT